MPALTEDQIRARLLLDEARERHRSRKRDTRRKVVAGAVVLGFAEHDPAFRGTLQGLLRQNLTRPHDRALFADFLQDG